MTRRFLRMVTTSPWRAAVAGLALLALVGAGFMGRVMPDGVATFQVKPGRFVREVEARGSLKAVKATPILVPQAKIDKARAEGQKNEASLGLDKDVAKEQLDSAETFKLTDESLYSRHQIIESQLDRDLFKARADVAGRKLQASGRLSSAERALGEIDADKARLKVQIAEKGLRSLRIQAPHDGLLVLERNWRGEVPSVGDTLWPGQKVAEVPDLTKLEAKVFVLEADGAGLKEGQKARFAIEGRPGEEYEASVSRVEPLAKTRDWQSPVKYFETTLSLAKDPGTLKPGQKVRAVVRLDEVDGVLTIPRGALFEKDGKRVVYRRAAGGFEAVEVTTSRQSISHLVVGAGLAAGDVIALRDPSAPRLSAPSGAAGTAGPGT
jgi:HlyD family secretion protein